MNVLIIGAGGPVANGFIRAMEPYHTLRLADIRPVESQHETVIVDIASGADVIEAARGMDAIANCSVIRSHPVRSFDVNTKGAYNVMKAAVAHDIRKVIHTSPQVIGSYDGDFDLNEGTSICPGTSFYSLTKYLGQEICRLFAESYRISVVCFLYMGVISADGCVFGSTKRYGPGDNFSPYHVSYEDAGQAARLALEAESLPSYYETFLIAGDMPHGKYSIEKAKRLLGFQPENDFHYVWRRSSGHA
jgi:nucleoside-diphosphate-sugar epimerase